MVATVDWELSSVFVRSELLPKKKEMLALQLSGFSNAEIAQRIDYSKNSIKRLASEARSDMGMPRGGIEAFLSAAFNEGISVFMLKSQFHACQEFYLQRTGATKKRLLAGVANGLKYQEIADDCGVSLDAIKSKAMPGLARKLEARSRIDAALAYAATAIHEGRLDKPNTRVHIIPAHENEQILTK